MSDQKLGIFTFEDVVMLNYEHLFQARQFKNKKGELTGTPKFDASLEIEANSPDLPRLKSKALAVAKALWPNRDVIAEFKAGTFKFPWSSGDFLADKAKALGKDREVSRGKVVLTTRSQYEPRLSVIENGQVVDYFDDRRPLAKPAFFDGALVLAEINLEAYESGQGPDGVTAYLNKVCSTKRGTRIQRRSTGADSFGGYAGKFSQESVDGSGGGAADF